MIVFTVQRKVIKLLLRNDLVSFIKVHCSQALGACFNTRNYSYFGNLSDKINRHDLLVYLITINPPKTIRSDEYRDRKTDKGELSFSYGFNTHSSNPNKDFFMFTIRAV